MTDQISTPSRIVRSAVVTKIVFAISICCCAMGVSSTLADDALAFRLADTDGESFQFSVETASRFTVICFLGTECPLARLYGPRLSKMADEFAAADVRFVGIISNRQDSMSDIRDYARKYDLSFPVLRDPGSKVADRFDANRTPEIFVLDQELRVAYHGRIDDQYAPGISRMEPARRDLREALSELIAGKPVSVPNTQPVGCLIGRVRDTAADSQNSVTYAEHVVPVLHRHCVECHRDGEIGPFAMEDYDEVAGWADTMMEVIDSGRMPPWHADPAFGEFRNERTMPEEDRQTIRDWIAGGLREGDLSAVPELPPAIDGWLLPRDPDLVVNMRDRPFRVPADGVVEYQYFVADPGFSADRWIAAAQALPGNRSVVHHIIVFVRPPELSQFRGIGWLTAYVPGQRSLQLPPGRARLVPAGSKLVFQMHYTPNGEAQDDLSRVGIVFADADDVTHEVCTLAALNQEFEIPPGAASHEVKASVRRIPDDGELLSITPHMHYRGRSFHLVNGESENAETLLRVPAYDFNWQHTYELSRPRPLADIDRLTFFATFDNSDANPFNPDATEWVTWGDQTWEEMAVAFFDVSEPRNSGEEHAESSAAGSPGTAQDDPEQREWVKRYVQRFLDRLDENRNGQIERAEASIVVRRKSFGRFDLNNDGIATRDEIAQVAQSLYHP